MIVNGERLNSLSVFPSMMTVPDCVVVGSNKLGSGHGEAKFYIGTKDEMRAFYGKEDFKAQCFMLKKDLIAYMNAVKNEYTNPSLEYAKKEQLPALWFERMDMIEKLDDVIFFYIYDQSQIVGPRGYIKSPDDGYQILRKIALPSVSRVYAEKVGSEAAPLFYWKLFVDFEEIKKNRSFVYSNWKQEQDSDGEKQNKIAEKKRLEISYARDGQGKYREMLLEQCGFCPFTMINDERLLIASHIKPWAAANDEEKIDPYNGYILSPMYDKLFDRGFITFTEEKHLILSACISPFTWKRLNLKNDMYIEALPMDDRRINYLKFHHDSVFKGSYGSDNKDVSFNRGDKSMYTFFQQVGLKVAEENVDYSEE